MTRLIVSAVRYFENCCFIQILLKQSSSTMKSDFEQRRSHVRRRAKTFESWDLSFHRRMGWSLELGLPIFQGFF